MAKKRGRPPKKKGVGDKVEDIFKKTGVKGLAELLNGGECEGCNRRKEKLNRLFETVKYNQIKGKPTPEQIETLKAIGLDKYKYTEEEADLIEGIYNQINHTNIILCRKCARAAQEWKAVMVRLKKMID